MSDYSPGHEYSEQYSSFGCLPGDVGVLPSGGHEPTATRSLSSSCHSDRPAMALNIEVKEMKPETGRGKRFWESSFNN